MKTPNSSFLEAMRINTAKEVIAQSAHSVKSQTVKSQVGESKTTVQRVHCPTCGSSAERYHLAADAIIRTQCARCDYLMVSCSKTGKVIESYSPGLSPSLLAAS